MSQPITPETPKPEIVPVGAIRFSPAEMPNRAQRNSIYTELGTLNFDDAKVRCYAHRQAGSLLFAFPDNSGYSLDTAQVGNQLYKYWKQTSVVPEPAENPVESTEKPTSES